MLDPSAESLFAAARLLSKSDCREFLQSECGANEKLRQRVEALLEADSEKGDLFDAVATTCDGSSLQADYVGRQIGRYKLLQSIGEGGFGVVFMAEQTEPVQRRVALKVIKPGMDTRAVVARFEAERQALALMEHPNIASVFDGGEIDGRPYFVMELVRGVPITEYCDANSLSTKERLSLFIDVCDAVQHAHGKGVIHRDIKPANVMVTLHDGRPVVKVIDFGVAKAVHTRLTERTMFTAYGQMIGTPQYMSPEQAEMSGLDVDIRTDVYSMGVLLYELITGAAPLSPAELRRASFIEMQRLIREQEAMPPSQKLTTTREQLITIAGHRGVSPDVLVRAVRGDLDWVVMKALDKDRQRRYETMREFSADVGSLLSGDAVIARPPSTMYRLTKFVRRYRAASMMVAVLLFAFVVSTAGMIRARQAEENGRQRLRELHEANGRLSDSRQESDRLLIAAEQAARVAGMQEARATRMARQSSSLRLAAEATRLVDSDPALSVTLATMARDTAITVSSYHNSVLLAALANHYEERSIDLKASRDREILTSKPTRCLSIGNNRVLIILDNSDVGAIAIDLSTGRELYRISIPRLHFDLIRVSPDQRVAATVSHGARYVTYRNGKRHSYTGRAIRLWDLANGRELQSLTGHDDRVQSVDFSIDGKQLISGSLDGTVRLWDVSRGEQLALIRMPETLRKRPHSIVDVSLSGDASYVLAIVEGRSMTAGYGLRRPGYADDPIIDSQGHPVSDELSGNFRMEPIDNGVKTVVVWPVAAPDESWAKEYSSDAQLVAGFAPATEGGGPHVVISDLLLDAGVTQTLNVATGDLLGSQPTSQFLDSVGPTDQRSVVVDGKLLTIRLANDTAVFSRSESYGNRVRGDAKKTEISGSFEARGHDVVWQRSDVELRPARLRGHRSNVVDVAFIGESLVSLDDSGILKVWRVGQMPMPSRLTLTANNVQLSAQFVDNNKVVAALGDPATTSFFGQPQFHPTIGFESIHLWETGSGRMQTLAPESQFAKPEGLLATLADLVSPSSGRLMIGGLTSFQVHSESRRLVTVHDDLHLVTELKPPRQADLSYTPVRIWDLRSGQVQQTLNGFRNSVADAAFNHDGSLLVTVESDRFNLATSGGGHSGGNNRQWFGGIEIWNVSDGTRVRSLVKFDDQSSVNHVQWHPSENYILCKYQRHGENVCEVYDASTGEVLMQLEDALYSTRYCPDGNSLVACDQSRVISYGLDRPPAIVAQAHDSQSVVDFAISSDGRRLCVVFSDGALQIVRLSDGAKEVETRVSFDSSCQVRFSPHGKWLMVAEKGATDLVILDVANGREWLKVSTDPLQQAVFSPDGRRVMTVDENQSAQVWPIDPIDAAVRRTGRALTQREERQLAIGLLDEEWFFGVTP